MPEMPGEHPGSEKMLPRKRGLIMSEEEIDAAIARNIERTMRDGPRLRYDNETPVLARDRKRGWVLLGGLGGMGVGSMWVKDNELYREYIGYEDAPENDSTGGFGTQSRTSWH